MSLNKIITNAMLDDMAESTIKGRASGAGTGDPSDLTAAQARNVIDPFSEVEETAAGPHADYDANGAKHIMCSNAAGVFNGLLASDYRLGDIVTFSHQGSGYTEFLHNVTSTVANRFFTGRLGKTPRIFDNEVLQFQLIDRVAGGVTTTAWTLVNPQPPFVQAADNAAGDIVAHNGTNYVVVSGGNSADVVLRGNSTFGTVSSAALANASVTPTKLAIVDANGEAATFSKRVAFSATGATGALVDVTIWNATAPFALRILSARLRVSTAAGTASALRTASGGGGSVVLPDVAAATQTFDTSTAGAFDDAASATATVAAGGSLFFNVDRAVAGEIVLTCVRT